LAPRSLAATVDAAQFETSLLNLVVNARDAMPNGGQLRIATGRETVNEAKARKMSGIPAGELVVITVEDTGTGMSQQVIDRAFEPFFTTKEVGKGTGLGLSQAFGFAKQSGGDISVVSKPGEGAKFTLYLPQAPAPAQADHVDPVRIEPVRSGRGHVVLVVDDNEEVGRFSAELLEDLGYSVRRAPNAMAALAILAEDEFAIDLVFSDVIMPGMDGVEFATLLREQYPGLPVVLTTGYSNVLAENTHLGFELIRKPYSVEVLSRILRKVLATKP
jgi:CheY-like chemotaxis protein